MEKEKTVIFTITSLFAKTVRENGKVIGKRAEFGRSRLVGWYSDVETAIKCVEEDWADFDEAGYYNYIVIERMVEGLYNMSGFDHDGRTEWWFEYDYKLNKWTACEKPDWSVGILNWGLG